MAEIISLDHKRSNREVTVCTRCVHFMNLEPGSSREHIWYNHLCKATPLPRKTDPYDGKMKPYTVNSLGGVYFTKHRFQYCRAVNDGKCPKYKVR